jgi:hypothetical protein
MSEREESLLRCLRYYQDEIEEIFSLACLAHREKRGKHDRLDRIASELLTLSNFMKRDIEEFERAEGGAS